MCHLDCRGREKGWKKRGEEGTEGDEALNSSTFPYSSLSASSNVFFLLSSTVPLSLFPVHDTILHSLPLSFLYSFYPFFSSSISSLHLLSHFSCQSCSPASHFPLHFTLTFTSQTCLSRREAWGEGTGGREGKEAVAGSRAGGKSHWDRGGGVRRMG